MARRTLALNVRQSLPFPYEFFTARLLPCERIGVRSAHQFASLLRQQAAAWIGKAGTSSQIACGDGSAGIRDRPADPPKGQRASGSSFRVTVLYTGMENTLAALRKAEELASGLDAHLLLAVPLVVPYKLPLTDPPVSPEFLVHKLSGSARHSMDICICVGRDYRQVCGRVLKTGSLVVVGGRKRWWPTQEEHLACGLAAAGHQVVYVEVG